jgi:hypothetical protein
MAGVSAGTERLAKEGGATNEESKRKMSAAQRNVGIEGMTRFYVQ